MELKSRKNILCLIVVGLLDLRARGQSDVTRRGVFADLWVSCFLQSCEEESRCGFGFCLCLSLSLSSGLQTVVCLPFDLPCCREICLSYCFSLLIRPDWVFFVFYLEGHGLAEKLLLIIFIFWQISSAFYYELTLCTETPFLCFEENISTDNIWWMLSWMLVAIIILCVR